MNFISHFHIVIYHAIVHHITLHYTTLHYIVAFFPIFCRGTFKHILICFSETPNGPESPDPDNLRLGISEPWPLLKTCGSPGMTMATYTILATIMHIRLLIRTIRIRIVITITMIIKTVTM